jgi:hypothetical protein
MVRSFWVLSLGLVACQLLSGANVCVSGNTLDTYIALGATGCDFGGLIVKDFAFSVVSFGGGDTPIADTDITVFLHSPVGGRQLEFLSTGFSVTGTQFVNYLLAFTWDPSGDMRNASDILDPGDADIVTDLCIGTAFVGAFCGGTPASLHVFQGGGPSVLFDEVNFPATGIVGVRNNIALTNNGNFVSIWNGVLIPEPASAAPAAAGLLMLAALLRRARKTDQIRL